MRWIEEGVDHGALGHGAPGAGGGHLFQDTPDRLEICDLPPDLVAPLFTRVRAVARAVEGALAAEGTFVAMNNRVSQSVPHLHVHVVPRRKGDGLKGFFWPRQKYGSDAEMREVADRIGRTLEAGRP